MAFINKFKNKKQEDSVPEGVKVEYSSFGQPQAGYTSTQVSQNLNSAVNGDQNSSKNKSNNAPSYAQTSVWSNEDDSNSIKLNSAQSKATKAKPNFMTKKEQTPTPPHQQQQQQTTQTNQTQNTQQTTSVQQNQRQEINLKIEPQPIVKKTKFEIKNELELLDDNQMNFPELDYQKKLVADIVAPGGIRAKQSEEALNNFAQDCQSLSPCVIGSILINLLFSNEANIVKQRSLYAAEILVKRYSKFQDFFKLQQFMIQKSQQFNFNDSKYVQLSNQLLAVVTNPSLEISDNNNINFNFSQAKDLSKFGKQNEQPAPVQNIQQKPQQVQQTATVNLIDDLLDTPAPVVNQPKQVQQNNQPTQSQNKPAGLFKNLSKKTTTDTPIPQQQQQQQQQQNIEQTQPQQGEGKSKLFGKFKTKTNNNTTVSNNNETNNKQDGDLLNLLDNEPNQNNLDSKLSLLNLYTNNDLNTNNNHNNHNNGMNYNQQPPQQYNMPPPDYNNNGLYHNMPPNNNGQPSFYPPPHGYNNYPQNGGYPQYHPHQVYQPNVYGQQPNNQYGQFNNNNGYQQASNNYSTIYMDFGDQKQNNLEQQLYGQTQFNLQDNTPNQKQNTQQKEKKQINEDAFDFISL